MYRVLLLRNIAILIMFNIRVGGPSARLVVVDITISLINNILVY